MKTPLFAVVAGILLSFGLTGCSKTDSPPVSSNNNAPVIPAAVPEPDPNQVAEAAPIVIPTVDESGNIPGVEIINSAIGDFVSANGRAPKSIQELITTKYLAKIPPAPAGKRYAIDAQRQQVTLVAQ